MQRVLSYKVLKEFVQERPCAPLGWPLISSKFTTFQTISNRPLCFTRGLRMCCVEEGDEKEEEMKEEEIKKEDLPGPARCDML